jgi:hypothetical protein
MAPFNALTETLFFFCSQMSSRSQSSARLLGTGSASKSVEVTVSANGIANEFLSEAPCLLP